MLLFGRDRELERIASVIRGPNECSLAVVGGQGIGKSALLSEIPRLSEYRTVFFSASSAESEWPLSGLTAFLDGLGDPVLNRIVDNFLSGSSKAIDLPGFSSAILSGLQHRSAARTVLVIDDAHHLDSETQSVIAFLARRLAGTDVALIMSVRDIPEDSAFVGMPTLQLRPLRYNDTVKLLEASPSRRTSTAEIHAVAEAAHGNPLAAVELYASLQERQSEGKYAMPIPLPCKGSFESDFARTVGGLTREARYVLELLALSCRTDRATLEKACPELWPSLDELLVLGLVAEIQSCLSIQNPLLRGYVFATMTPALRIDRHRMLAAAAEASDPHARRWHLSFTALVQQTPFSLLRSAVQLIRRGDLPFALECVERALTINPWEAETAERLITIAELLFGQGNFVYAKRYLEWAQRITRNPALILRLTALSLNIEFMQGGSVRSSMVLRLAKEFGRYNVVLTARLVAVGALYYAERRELGAASELTKCAAELLELLPKNVGAGIAEDIERAQLLIESIDGHFEHGETLPLPPAAGGLPALVVARAHCYAERHDLAYDTFRRIRESNCPETANWRETAAVLAVDNEIKAGHIRTAVRLIEELELNEPEAQHHRGMRHLFRIWRSHMLGNETLAAMYTAEAHRFASPETHPALITQLAAWEGHFALIRGNLATAHAQLARAWELGAGLRNPAILRCEPDLVEVLVRLGRHSEAQEVLTRLERRSAGVQSPWLMIAIARSRALVADGEQSLQLFSQALKLREPHELVVERARTLLCHAERLMAFGRLREARNGMMRAKVMFDESAADAWTQHVDRLLLDERMESATPKGNPAMLMLADHERALAQMVARGMRNKEIAATLYVSVRTVEVRLTAIYRKLGVESRAQLTALASGRDTTAHEPYVLPVL